MVFVWIKRAIDDVNTRDRITNEYLYGEDKVRCT